MESVVYQTDITKTCSCNIQKQFLVVKMKIFTGKISKFFAQNIDYGYPLEPPRRGGSNEYPQSMFWSKNKKNRYTPANPSFAILKWGKRGYTFYGHVFLMETICEMDKAKILHNNNLSSGKHVRAIYTPSNPTFI